MVLHCCWLAIKTVSAEGLLLERCRHTPLFFVLLYWGLKEGKSL